VDPEDADLRDETAFNAPRERCFDLARDLDLHLLIVQRNRVIKEVAEKGL
jgi:hypothetical protein